MSPQHVWQLSMYPPPPVTSSFPLLANHGDFFYWEKKKETGIGTQQPEFSFSSLPL